MPTTDMPITVPLLKATRNAGFSPCIALTAVRVLARTAMLMPMKPASPEPIAPMRYDSAVEGKPLLAPTLPVTSKSMNTARIIATTTTNAASSVYSLVRNAIAPCCMARPMN